MKGLMFAACLGVAVLSTGCNDDSGKSQPSTGGAASSGGAAPAATQQATSGEHKRLPIGETTMSGLKLVATMDEPVKPGGEGAFDVVITGGKPKAVRFWVGTENAEGSVKAKAEEETTDNWHTHAEVPDPLPAGSKFWVEVEPQTGAPFKTSFDLKVQ
jgi:hypothetical protein